MATISITVPDAVVGRVRAAFAVAFEADRQEGETDTQLAKRKIAEFVREVTIATEAQAVAEAARARAIETAGAEIVVS